MRSALNASALGLLLAATLAATTVASAAQEAPADLPKIKQTKLGKYLSAREAADILKKEAARTLFVDIRTRGEVQFVGFPAGIDAHIPYVELNEFGDWDAKANRYKVDLNTMFGQDIERRMATKALSKTDRIILICRSGDRSARAANLLADIGYTNVYSLYEGFEGDLSRDGLRNINGWRNAGLPWTYKLTAAQAYKAAR